MDVGFKTDKGKQRMNNEDAFFVMGNDKVFIVADGVGGGKAGEIASRTCVNEIAKYLEKNNINESGSKYAIINHLQECLDITNEKIYTLSNTYEENNGMATTLSLLYITKEVAFIANVGDSRVYIIRDGCLNQLTEDHTYVNTLVKAGVISKEQAQSDDRKNVITKALGANISVEPDFFQVGIIEDDVFLICTDGLYNEVPEDLIIDTVLKSENMSEACRKLVEEANNHGGHDNITIICLKITEEDIHEQ